MVRLKDMVSIDAEHLLKLKCNPLSGSPFITGPPLDRRRVAIISTAGLHAKNDRPFGLGAADYRVIPSGLPAADLVMSHISTNYDRTGYMMDQNVAFPLDRLRELAEEGFIGSMGRYHYSFMGATPPEEMEEGAKEVARQLKGDGVDSVLLVPV